MPVRAKFTVQSITDAGPHSPKTVRLTALYDNTIEEDRRFCKATPWGAIEMSIDNPAALEQFKIGQSFYADFTPVPQPQASAESTTRIGG